MTPVDDATQYEADAHEAVSDTNILARITKTAKLLRDCQEDVKLAEAALKAAQDRVRILEELDLPALMDEAGQNLLQTTDGYQLERGETLRASIPPANLLEAIQWLRANNQDAIVKRDVTVKFGKGEDQKAAETVDSLLEAGLTPTDKQFVHPMTLASTIREMLEQGVDVPMTLLGAYVQPHVKMKKVKK